MVVYGVCFLLVALADCVMAVYLAVTIATQVSTTWTCIVQPLNREHLWTKASVLYSGVSFICLLLLCIFV